MKLWHRYRTLTWTGPIEVPAATPQAVAIVFNREGLRVTQLREVGSERLDSAVAIIAEESMDAPTTIFTGILRPDKRRSKTLTGAPSASVTVPIDANMHAWLDHEAARLNVGRTEIVRMAILAAMHALNGVVA